VAYNIRNANYQARIQAKLKAIEVVIAAAGPNSARERLAVVRQLLGNDLIESSLANNLVIHGVGPGHDQSRKDLIKMLLEYPDRREEVLQLWEIAFGRSRLKENIQEIRAALQDGKSGSPA